MANVSRNVKSDLDSSLNPNEDSLFTQFKSASFNASRVDGNITTTENIDGFGWDGSSNLKQIDLRYPSDIDTFPGYTAFFISVRKNDKVTLSKLGLSDKSPSYEFGKRGYDESLRKVSTELIEKGVEWMSGAKKTANDSNSSQTQKNIPASSKNIDTLQKLETLSTEMLPGAVQQKACIILPTPKLSTNYAVDWSSNTDNIKQTLNVVANAVSNNDATVDKIIAGVTAGAQQLGAKALLGGSIFSKAFGVIPNPQKDQYFNDVNFRTFSFSWTFAPRNREEASNIFSIIKMFKYHMLPRESENKILWIYPSEFDIVHIYNKKWNSYLPRHTTSVLTNVSVEYGDSGNMQYIEGGVPPFISLSLSFSELAVITKSDIERGY